MKQVSIVICIFCLQACWLRPGSPEIRETKRYAEEAFFHHEVRHSGETFSAISLWYTGAVDNWKKLEAANSHLRARRLRLGDTINIPEHLLKRRVPLPASFVSQRRFERRGEVPMESHESDAPEGPSDAAVAELMEPHSRPAPPDSPLPAEPSVFFGGEAGTPVEADKKLEEQQKKELLENLLK